MEMSTVTQTVIAGVLVFIVGQLFLKLVIEPVHQLKRTMADISHTFIQYAYVIHNSEVISSELRVEVFEKLRQLSGQLYADMALIPLYSVFGKLFFLPSRSKVYKSATNLIAVANWMHTNNERKFEHIIRNIQNACDNLGLYIDPNDRVPDELLK
jgi:hypothetical protein